MRQNNKSKKWAVAGIIISWATFWIFLFSPFGLLAWLGILVYLIIKRSKLTWYLILSAWLFVPSCSFLIGTVNYFTGTASLIGVGGPQTVHGIDRETRVSLTSFGCILLGFEPFVFPANNAAVRLCTDLFGFQKGAYKGVFPTEEEAQEIIKSADTIVVKHAGNFLQFNTSGQLIKIDTLSVYRSRSKSTAFDTVIGKTIKNECFVFQRSSKNDDDTRMVIYLVDIGKNSLLTTYFY